MDYSLENEKRLRTVFLLLNITHVSVSFDGSGDSGQIDHIAIESNGIEVGGDSPITVWRNGRSVFNTEASKWETGEPFEETVSLTEAITDHVNAALDKSGVDWYNNDGGYGEWTWDASTGLEFNINVRITESSLEHSESRQLGEEESEESPAEEAVE
jgi:hypothetical protein